MSFSTDERGMALPLALMALVDWAFVFAIGLSLLRSKTASVLLLFGFALVSRRYARRLATHARHLAGIGRRELLAPPFEITHVRVRCCGPGQDDEHQVMPLPDRGITERPATERRQGEVR